MSWNDDGRYVALRTAACTHLLTFHPELIPAEAAEGEVEESFEITGEVSGSTRSGLWYKEAYLTVLNNKLTIHIGDHVVSRRIFDLGRPALLRAAHLHHAALSAVDRHCLLYGPSSRCFLPS